VISKKIEYIEDHVINYRYPLDTRESQEYYRDELREEMQSLEHYMNLLRWARNGELKFEVE
jgi:hypothetical protein